MSLFLFLLSVSGNLSALRMIAFFRGRNLIAEKTLTKIGTAMLALLLLAVFLCAANIFHALIAHIVLLSAFTCALWMMERRQIEELKCEAREFLDQWILFLKLGNSLSAARAAALTASSAPLKTLLAPLFVGQESVSPRHLILPEEVLSEFRQLASVPHAALERLTNLRETIRKADEFRRKSGQATRQTAIQALLLLFMQLALAVFTVRKYGWRENSDLILVSTLLSLTGWFVMHRLSRKVKWKI